MNTKAKRMEATRRPVSAKAQPTKAQDHPQEAADQRRRTKAVVPPEERQAVRRSLGLLCISKAGFAWSVLAGSMTLVCSVCLAALSAWLIARASQMPLIPTLTLAATGVRAFGASKPVLRYFRQIAAHRVALYGMSNLRSAVYRILADSPIEAVASIKRGDLLARTGRDVSAVGDLVVRALEPMAVAVATSLFSVALVAFFSPACALALALCLLLAGIASPYCAMRGARRAELSQIHDRAELAALSLTMLESASELRVSGRLAELEAAAAETERQIFANRDAAARPTALATAIDSLAMGLAVIAAIVIGAGQLAAGQLAPVELAIVVLTPLAAFEATMPLAGAGIQFVRSAGAAKRIIDLLDSAQPDGGEPARPTGQRQGKPEEAQEAGQAHGHQADDVQRAAASTAAKATPAGPATTATPAAASEPAPEPAAPAPAGDSSLIARDLRIGWPAGPVVAGPFDLDIPRGTTTAIVGPSGIGKTTLLYTLAGLLHPKSGTVKLGGREASSLPRDEVSRTLVLTAEDAHVFATTVLENIRVARPDVTEQEAADLLRRAGLDQWLAELDQGVHTMLDQDATNISGGERRRLLFARALASPAQFLLLDEPAEHLDAQTADALITDLIAAAKESSREAGTADGATATDAAHSTTDVSRNTTSHPGGRTIVIVTHRLSALAGADRVILLSKEGETTGVAAAGTHAELVSLMPDYRWSLQQEK